MEMFASTLVQMADQFHFQTHIWVLALHPYLMAWPLARDVTLVEDTTIHGNCHRFHS
jgi:hypothetical protein